MSQHPVRVSGPPTASGGRRHVPSGRARQARLRAPDARNYSILATLHHFYDVELSPPPSFGRDNFRGRLHNNAASVARTGPERDE